MTPPMTRVVIGHRMREVLRALDAGTDVYARRANDESRYWHISFGKSPHGLTVIKGRTGYTLEQQGLVEWVVVPGMSGWLIAERGASFVPGTLADVFTKEEATP